MGSPLIKVAIHGVPRSGTTWLAELFNSHPSTVYRFQPLFSYALKDFINEQSPPELIEEFFERLQSIQDDFIDQKETRDAGLLPTFEKTEPTHIVYKEVRYHNVLPNLMENTKDVKLVLLIRSPISVLESWMSAPREFRRDLGWNVEDEWRNAPSKNQNRSEEFYGLEGWKRATSIFHKLQTSFPKRVRLLRYEDLVNSTEPIIRKLFEFCALVMHDQTMDFIRQSKTRFVDNPYSVFRGKKSKSDKKSQLGKDVVEQITRELKGSEFERYLSEPVAHS